MMNHLELIAKILEKDNFNPNSRGAIEQIKNPSWMNLIWVSSQFEIFQHNVLDPVKKPESLLSDDIKAKILGEPKLPSSFYHQATQDYWVQVPLQGSQGYLLGSISKSTMLRYRYFFIFQTSLLILFFICLSYVVSWWLSFAYTKRLSKLTEIVDLFQLQSTRFELDLPGKDEISKLAQHFSTMAKRIEKNLSELKDKFRMQSELETAQKVQKFLFPSKPIDDEKVYVGGLYQPATECGGDWWYYTKQGSILYFMIGDVTGHGTSSALMTSCCRGVISILLEKNGNQILPNDLLRQLNSAIYETAGTELNMTFFAARLDTQSGLLQYSNASHELPLIFNKNIEIKKAREIQVLDQVHGPRLGEKGDPVFKLSQVQLTKGDRLVLHSDGVLELNVEESKILGERGYLKLITQCNPYSQAQEFHQALNQKLTQLFKKGLPDDVSLVFFEWRGEG
jgi:sigma-B regulation protein RsbU (phosphoserine phosphatase)